MFKRVFSKGLKTLLKLAFLNCFRIFILKIMGVKVGKRVYIGDYFCITGTLGSEKRLIIEDRVSISPNVNLVLVSSPNHSNLLNYKNIYGFVEVVGEIIIKHDSWIGVGAIILPNVTVGEYAIVGAGSVVTRDVPPYTVVAGVPAKVIKKLKIS
jgi:acetyltransferase-like isoleucine patch superfamily enzyme